MRISGGKVPARAHLAWRARRTCSPGRQGPLGLCHAGTSERLPGSGGQNQREGVLPGGWKDAEEARSRVSLEGLLALTLSGLAHAASKRRQLTVRTVLGLIVSFSCRHTHLRDFWERRPTLLPTRVLPKS